MTQDDSLHLEQLNSIKSRGLRHLYGKVTEMRKELESSLKSFKDTHKDATGHVLNGLSYIEWKALLIGKVAQCNDILYQILNAERQMEQDEQEEAERQSEFYMELDEDDPRI